MLADTALVVSIVSSAIAATSAAIAAVSAFVGYRNYSREQLNQKIQTLKWRMEYFSDFRKWSDQSMLLLSEAMHLCELDSQKSESDKFFERCHALRVELSAEIDKGRWFFPNHPIEHHGQDKELAYRGYRHAILDGLVNAYTELTTLSCVDTSRNARARRSIEMGKRLFVSEVQEVLDPRTRDEEFKRLTGLIEGG